MANQPLVLINGKVSQPEVEAFDPGRVLARLRNRMEAEVRSTRSPRPVASFISPDNLQLMLQERRWVALISTAADYGAQLLRREFGSTLLAEPLPATVDLGEFGLIISPDMQCLARVIFNERCATTTDLDHEVLWQTHDLLNAAQKEEVFKATLLLFLHKASLLKVMTSFTLDQIPTTGVARRQQAFLSG